MKKVLAFLLTALLVFPFYAQEGSLEEKERIQYKKTKVSTETLMGYGVDEYGKALPIGTKKSTRTFDENGNMTMVVEYNSKSAPVSRTVLKYDKNSQVINGFEYEGFDKLIDKYSVNYKDGNKIKKTGVLDSNKYEIQYKYDSKGNLIEKTKFEGSGQKEYQYQYEYAGGLVKKETYWSDDFTLIKSFEYDSVGHLSKETSSTEKFEGYSFVYVYDSLGNKIKETKMSSEDIPYEWFEYTYLPNKQINTIEKYNYLGHKSYTWRYFYDAKNNIEFIKIYEGDDTQLIYITQYLYKYFEAAVQTNPTPK